MSYQDLPEELKSVNQWGLYRKEWNDTSSRYTKIPVSAMTGRHASSTDERTWTTFDEALANMEIFDADGLAFFLKPPFFGIDMDHYQDEIDLYEQGYNTTQLGMAIEAMGSYTELSQSHEGIHIIAKGTLPGDKSRQNQDGDKVVEMYSTGRFFALTGMSIMGHKDTINAPGQEMIDHVYNTLIRPEERPKLEDVVIEHNDLTKEEVIEKALASNGGAHFKKLYDGNWQDEYGSASEADLAFVNLLAFWTGRDRYLMDAIFRDSGLMRDKWDEKHGKSTYGEGTINRAITDVTETYRPKTEAFSVVIGNGDEEKVYPHHDYTDQGMAERFYERWGDKVLHVDSEKSETTFMVFDGTVWKRDVERVVHKLFIKLSDIILETEEPIMPPEPTVENYPDQKDLELAEKNYSKDKKSAINAFHKFAKSVRTDKGLNSAKKLLASMVNVDINIFDKEVGVINTPDGVYDLATGERSDNDPKRYFTKSTLIAPDKNLEPKEFKTFLNQVMLGDADMVDYLMKFVGYSMFGNGEEQEYVLLYGNGRNGKGVLMSAIKNALGDYVTAVNPDTFMDDGKKSTSNNDELARLRGARLVSVSEIAQNKKLDAAIIKKLTGGGTFVANEKYNRPYEFQSAGVPFFDTNYLPQINDTSEGIWRRTNVIPFNLTIKEEDVDVNLGHKLETEAGAILWYLIKAATKWRNEGLGPVPYAVKQANEKYHSSSDPIGEFIKETFIENEAGFVEGPDVTNAWGQFVGEEPDDYPTRKMLGSELAKRFKTKRTARGRGYKGIMLKEGVSYTFKIPEH